MCIPNGEGAWIGSPVVVHCQYKSGHWGISCKTARSVEHIILKLWDFWSMKKETPLRGESDDSCSFGLGGSKASESSKGLEGLEALPKGSYVVPFWGSILESPIPNPKRNYIGAFG